MEILPKENNKDDGEFVYKEPEYIDIFYSNHQFFIWDPETALYLRSHFRIVGTMVGSLPHLVQQNIFLGLPLLLMNEQVLICYEQGLKVRIFDDTQKYPKPSNQEMQDFLDFRKKKIWKKRKKTL